MQQVKAKTCNLVVLILSFIMVAIVTVRAAITGITYDEAFTYNYYVYPLYKDFTFSHILEISRSALANNHWLNTLMIAGITKLTGVIFQEFIIRLPVLIFGWLYYLYAAYCKLKNKINWFEFFLLIGSYYSNEFLGLARGYGICMSLIFVALIKYKDFEKTQKLRYFWISMFLLVLASYANSVCLLVIGALGMAFILFQIRYRKNFIFVKENFIWIPLWILSVAYIVWYHFRVTDVDNGMPLYRTDYSGGVVFYLKQYAFLTFHSEAKWIVEIIGALLLVSIIVLVIKRKLLSNQIGTAFIIHFCLLIAMDLVFKRGGLLYRTLLPAYPLFVLGATSLVGSCLAYIKEKNTYIYKSMVYLVTIISVSLMLVNGINTFNLEGTSDWDSNYEIKWKEYSGFDLGYDVIQEFYENQKNSMICKIYGLEFDK